MIQFWLTNIKDLINPANLSFDDNNNYVKILNLIALSSILIGSSLVVIKKKSIYFGFIVIILSLTILINSNISSSGFSGNVNVNVNAFDTGVYLVKATGDNPNIVYVNNSLNFNKGDIIAFSVNGKILETNIISDIQYNSESIPILVLLNGLRNSYSKYSTRILKVSDSMPNIIPPPDANESIQGAGRSELTESMAMAAKNFPKNSLPNPDRYDWNLELSSMGGMEPGQPPSYVYQGQPYGNLKCRRSTSDNPMGTINLTEYDQAPTIFGTCNVGEDNNNNLMTTNQEGTVSQRVSDLLFHKGNSQSQFSPVPVDTMPNQQEEFAHFCYRSPTNLVNPKYASIFVNDPDKFKLVSKLARATGTENGGGGGR